jgi:hypothetical protein
MKFSACSLVVLGILVPVVSPRALALSDGEAATGRLIARRYGDAIVGVRGTAIMRITVGERTVPPKEDKIDVNGTMITATGLTVTSLNAIDLRTAFEAMRSQFKSGSEPVELAKTEFKGLRLRLADGTEIPAKIAWKDLSRDLVFLAPADETVADKRLFAFVNLNDAQESASVLGNYYHVSRAGEGFQRVLLVRACTVTAIIERPLRLLMVSTDLCSDVIGCPVFDPSGRVLGICLHCMDNGLPKSPVVVPAADVAAIGANAFAPR